MKNNTKRMIINRLIALIPVFIFGFYKNGLFLYYKNLLNFTGIFKPLLLVIIGFCASILVNYIFSKDKNKYNIFDDISVLDGVFIAMLMPPKINIIFFSVVLFILLVISKYLFNKFKFNKVAFINVVFILLIVYVLKIDFLNIYEASSDVALTTFDLFTGKGVGGILSTSCLGLIIGYFFLATEFSYKKEIPFYICISFFIIVLIYGIMKHDVMLPLRLIMGDSIIFVSVFIATDTLSSPYTKKGKGFYGLIIGVLTAVLTIMFNHHISVFIVILGISLIFPFLDKIFYKKLKI